MSGWESYQARAPLNDVVLPTPVRPATVCRTQCAALCHVHQPMCRYGPRHGRLVCDLFLSPASIVTIIVPSQELRRLWSHNRPQRNLFPPHPTSHSAILTSHSQTTPVPGHHCLVHPLNTSCDIVPGKMMQAADNGAAFSCPSLTWDLIFRVFEFLPANEVVLICRLACKEVRRRFSQPDYRTARFGLPFPPASCCGAWRPHLRQSLKQLTFCGKLQMLSAAASSGSGVNLELAWDVLCPCLVHGMASGEFWDATDAGAAAVKSGRLHLLPWLLQHGCPLDVRSTLEAAAEHCDLVGLQRVWELLRCGSDPPGRHDATLLGKLACSAARYGRDAMAKLTWLMAMADGSSFYKGPWLLLNAATGAASSGRLPVLQWLLEVALRGGVPMEDLWSRVVDGKARGLILAQALEAGHVAMADWLVEVARYPLPQQEDNQQQEAERELLWAVTAMGGSVDALRWLQRRGVPVDAYALPSAAEFGHLGAVRFLHEECGLGLEHVALCDAAGSRSVPTAQWLLQAGCRMGPRVYEVAAGAGDVAMIRWLVLDAKCPWYTDTYTNIVERWAYEPGSSIDGLKEAVRLLLEAGCPCDAKPGAADGAAATGRLPLLRYLHEDLGVGFGPGTLAAAARGGCEEVLEWLVGAGCRAGEGQFRSHEPYVVAAGNGDMATLGCLRRLGVPWNERMVIWAVEHASMPPLAVRWLVQQGAPLGREAVEKAKARARDEAQWRECAEWLALRWQSAARDGGACYTR